jgi:hypothetical protein
VRHRAILLVLLAATLAGLGGCGSGGHGFAAEANAICSNLGASPGGASANPKTPQEALETSRRILQLYRRTVDRLEGLAAPEAVSAEFQAGLADLRALDRQVTWMVDRPDYLQLATTLPDHPELAPAWARAWVAGLGRLNADARLRFERIGAPACAEHAS